MLAAETMSDQEKARQLVWTGVGDRMHLEYRILLESAIAKALAEARAEERARSAKLVQALEFYAAGHPHHSVLFHNVDYERIPKVRTVCVISEIAKGKTGEQVYNEGMKPLFELRSGLKARQTLATYRAGDAG